MLRVTLKTGDGQPAGAETQIVEFDSHQNRRGDLPDSAGALSAVVAGFALALSRRAGIVRRRPAGSRLGGAVRRAELEVRGDRFFFNDKPFFVRGYGDDFVYPLTLVSPASREEHLRHFKAARQAGFLYVRLHTHCELPEYFEAADEAGVLVQPELPDYGDYPTEAFNFDPMRDLKELITHYRRYVSLATYCMGNEGLLGRPLDIRDLQAHQTARP